MGHGLTLRPTSRTAPSRGPARAGLAPRGRKPRRRGADNPGAVPCVYRQPRRSGPPMSKPSREAGVASLPIATGIAIALGVFVCQVPFLSPGFGTDSDTWKFASALREMAETGRYTASRMPGYPLMEIVSLPSYALGPWAQNALSALASAACAWLAARLFARHGLRDAWLAGVAFAFVPAAFIAGSSSIDYLWAIAFALAAWLDTMQGRPVRAGLWLGLALGTRLTSVLFGIPLAILLWQAPGGARAWRLVQAFGVAALVGAAWYVPVFARYGWEMFTYSEITGGQSSALRLLPGLSRSGVGEVPLPLIAGQATVVLLGVLGCLAIGLALFSLVQQRPDAPRAARLERPAAWAIATLVALELLLYARLPHDEGYLLPVVPFVLLALASRLTVPRFRAVCAALILSPFLLGVDVEPPKKGPTPAEPSPFAVRVPISGQTIVVEPLRGPAMRDHAKRLEQRRLAASLEAWWPRRPERFLLAAGNSMPMLYHLFPQAPRARPFVRTLDDRQRAEATASGVALFALPDAMRRMRVMGGGDAVEGITLLAGAGQSP